MIVAMVGFALHTRETLPLHNMCADITFRLGWFERRGQSGKAASMPYGDHGFASHAATEGDHAVCRRDDGFLLVGEQVDARCPGSHCCFGASYLPTTCVPFNGHRIRATQDSDVSPEFVFAYVGSADHRQHTSSMTHASAHTIMIWHNCWRMSFFSSWTILFRWIRRRYSCSFMMAPSRCCIAVSLC